MAAHKKIVCFGEVLLRLGSPGYLRFNQADNFIATYCGGEVNVAVSLSRFGMNAHFVTRLPENDIAAACLENINKYGVKTQHVVYGGERLGLYYLETGSGSRPGRIIYDRRYSSFSETEPSMFCWEKILANMDWFHWTGITPALSEGTARACMDAIEFANKAGITVSADLNFRKSLWKYGRSVEEVLSPLIAKTDILLANEEHVRSVFAMRPGIEVDPQSGRSIHAHGEKMLERFPRLKKIIFTTRKSINANHNMIAGFLYDGQKLVESRTYDIVHMVDRVGSGDAFMAGLIYGMLTYGQDSQTIINFAAAACCLKHSLHGDFNLSSVEEVIALMESDGSGRFER